MHVTGFETARALEFLHDCRQQIAAIIVQA
jgi:hypothetical protein